MQEQIFCSLRDVMFADHAGSAHYKDVMNVKNTGASSTYRYKLATGIRISSGATKGLIRSAKVTDSKAS